MKVFVALSHILRVHRQFKEQDSLISITELVFLLNLIILLRYTNTSDPDAYWIRFQNTNSVEQTKKSIVKVQQLNNWGKES